MEKKNETNVMDFFKDHSDNYLKMALRTDRQEFIDKPDGYGKKTRGCGDTVEMFLMVGRDKRIQSLSFIVNGCIHTNACANTVAFLAEGGSIKEAWKISSGDVIEYLETLPSAEAHCAELAVGALYAALTDYQKIDRDPWKKLYR